MALAGAEVKMVGATGFEPATSWSQTKCSTRLSYAPIPKRVNIDAISVPRNDYLTISPNSSRRGFCLHSRRAFGNKPRFLMRRDEPRIAPLAPSGLAKLYIQPP